jgi:hypothetical protein
MTTLQILSLLIMPISGLLIAGLGVLWVRTWDRDQAQPGE